MVGGLSMVGSSSSVIVNQQCSIIIKRRKQISSSKPKSLDLKSSFTNSWQGWRISTKVATLSTSWKHNGNNKHRKFVLVNELGGQYEDTFEDVKTALVNYLTYKAVKTVMNQLYEMNPPQYIWFYQFVATNKPAEGKNFIRKLWKEKHELAERVMVTRLHLYGKWMKKCNHAEIYNSISDENLALMRERLMETVVWPSDDSSTEKIG
ncbi:hypothetical protein ACFE04_006043 [Oxalis oulophora]